MTVLLFILIGMFATPSYTAQQIATTTATQTVYTSGWIYPVFPMYYDLTERAKIAPYFTKAATSLSKQQQAAARHAITIYETLLGDERAIRARIVRAFETSSGTPPLEELIQQFMIHNYYLENNHPLYRTKVTAEYTAWIKIVFTYYFEECIKRSQAGQVLARAEYTPYGPQITYLSGFPNYLTKHPHTFWNIPYLTVESIEQCQPADYLRTVCINITTPSALQTFVSVALQTQSISNQSSSTTSSSSQPQISSNSVDELAAFFNTVSLSSAQEQSPQQQQDSTTQNMKL